MIAAGTTTARDTSGETRGRDAEGHRVVVGWVQADGREYLVGLTLCCEATATCDQDGAIVCRACYHDCSPALATEAVLA